MELRKFESRELTREEGREREEGGGGEGERRRDGRSKMKREKQGMQTGLVKCVVCVVWCVCSV